MEFLSHDYDISKCKQRSQITYNDYVYELCWNEEESFAVMKGGQQIVKFTDPHITFLECLELVGVDNPTVNISFMDRPISSEDLLSFEVEFLPLCQVDILSEYTIEYLLRVLQKYNGLETLTDVQYNQMYRQVKNAANHVLIGDEGECVWKNHQVLEEAGFDVFPLERDRYGWLVGGIETRHGVVDFG